MADSSLSTESIVVFEKYKVSLTISKIEVGEILQNAMETGLNRGTGTAEILSCIGLSKRKLE